MAAVRGRLQRGASSEVTGRGVWAAGRVPVCPTLPTLTADVIILGDLNDQGYPRAVQIRAQGRVSRPLRFTVRMTRIVSTSLSPGSWAMLVVR